jgi:hypothetical protein
MVLSSDEFAVRWVHSSELTFSCNLGANAWIIAAVDTSFRLASWATIIFLALFYISTQAASLVQCLSTHGNWDLTGETGKK